MDLGQVGPLTMVLEATATAVGAGVVLGSFGSGLVGLLLGDSRAAFEARVLRDGYIGGGAAVLVALADITLRYAF
jgi:hypothetical protein